MPLTAEQRAEINRQNASKSTGPKTPEGKAASRQNAVRHGLRVETLAIPTEDPAALQALAERWHDYYRPASPGEEELVDLAVYAIVQRRRGARQLSAALTRQVRAAEVEFDQASREVVERLGPVFFGPRPFEAVIEAKRTAAGCRFLLGFWDEVADQYDRQGFLNPQERDLVVRLSGVLPEDSAREPLAYLTRLYNYLCQPNECPKTVARMLEPPNVPVRLRDTMALWTPTPEAARDWLSDKIREDRADLEALEDRLRLEIEEPDRADASERAALLLGPEAALMLRYERMHELAFHRAYNALLKGRKDAARAGHEEEEPEAPNEAKSPAPNESSEHIVAPQPMKMASCRGDRDEGDLSPGGLRDLDGRDACPTEEGESGQPWELPSSPFMATQA